MSIIDLLVAIIVVTILVTIFLGVVTYLAYKLRLARKPSGAATGAPEPRYFRLHLPPERDSAGDADPVPAGTAALQRAGASA